MLSMSMAGSMAQVAASPDGSNSSAGPVRLRQPAVSTAAPLRDETTRRLDQNESRLLAAQSAGGERPNEFETYVRRLPGGSGIQRFGLDLLNGLSSTSGDVDYNPLVPPDYVVRAGDELVLTLWGSVDADLRLQVDRGGRITIPRVGPVMVSGVRYADLSDTISRRVGLVFKNFQLSVSMGQLRGTRVYVTGFVQRPGAYTVSSLSTLVQALGKAGGPSSAGSFRAIQLRRGSTMVTQLDLYNLLLKGDRTADLRLEADDVIHVAAVGPQVALIGSVNRPAIFEVKAGEAIEALLSMAGGFSPVADRDRLMLERLGTANGPRIAQLEWPSGNATALRNGDVVRAVNAGDLILPTSAHYKRVRIEGEVARPGEYVLPPASSLSDALLAAGGISSRAYLYAAEFTRESVRQTQQVNYERALRDLETQVNSAAATKRTSSPEEAAAQAAALTSNARFLEQLRSLKPSGRIVLQTTPDADSLPDLALEDGDRLVIPARPTTVGVFGSVFSTGSYLHSARKTVGDYLRLAGGPTRGADDSSTFVIRGNGSVSSSLQESGMFSRGNQITSFSVEPGDTIFVPEELNKVTWLQNAKDWTQLLYQLGIGIAGIKSAVN
jgi:protein involved in polysaccharide export with SLBB domain